MEFKKFNDKYIIRIDRGEEVVASLMAFCKAEHISLGSISGLGATDRVTIGLFNVAEKQYHKETLTGDFEITNLTGNISTKEGEPYLHLHITLGDASFHAFGGHLNECWISGTCELVIDAIDGTVERTFNEGVGLNLYAF
ncbi:DNA-binding protein [Fusibacter paucivorans]|uniref:DNA-binding protein n=1 Tax=Fusibacter paucivorans TaxID=76009 RepID=A0ABS5PNK5_9FIRM|nr:PPC domain-containing DNA-binding protein [Fusibacter paucivorans]MBS7526754.1 DNA-binding protein [Fusibacter paucivorans]